SMGSMASEVRLSINKLREEGLKIGAVRLRLYRPFPAEDLNKLLPKNSTLVVLDRNYAFGMDSGILFSEAKSALFDRGGELTLKNKIMGIGGQDLTWQLMADEIKKLLV
ncbi:MAG: pyruvate synthase, partial [Clostridiales bacterium]